MLGLLTRICLLRASFWLTALTPHRFGADAPLNSVGQLCATGIRFIHWWRGARHHSTFRTRDIIVFIKLNRYYCFCVTLSSEKRSNFTLSFDVERNGCQVFFSVGIEKTKEMEFRALQNQSTPVIVASDGALELNESRSECEMRMECCMRFTVDWNQHDGITYVAAREHEHLNMQSYGTVAVVSAPPREICENAS